MNEFNLLKIHSGKNVRLHSPNGSWVGQARGNVIRGGRGVRRDRF